MATGIDSCCRNQLEEEEVEMYLQGGVMCMIARELSLGAVLAWQKRAKYTSKTVPIHAREIHNRGFAELPRSKRHRYESVGGRGSLFEGSLLGQVRLAQAQGPSLRVPGSISILLRDRNRTKTSTRKKITV